MNEAQKESNNDDLDYLKAVPFLKILHQSTIIQITGEF